MTMTWNITLEISVFFYVLNFTIEMFQAMPDVTCLLTVDENTNEAWILSYDNYQEIKENMYSDQVLGLDPSLDQVCFSSLVFTELISNWMTLSKKGGLSTLIFQLSRLAVAYSLVMLTSNSAKLPKFRETKRCTSHHYDINFSCAVVLCEIESFQVYTVRQFASSLC